MSTGLMYSHYVIWLAAVGLTGISISPLTASENNAPAQDITSFYQHYFQYIEHSDPHQSRPSLIFSNSLLKLQNDNRALCALHSDEKALCGWNSHGDEYLNAQQWDPRLNATNARLHVSVLENHVIQVSFTLYPFNPESQHTSRQIRYQMVQENGQWVVDDITYENNISVRMQIEQENAFFEQPEEN